MSHGPSTFRVTDVKRAVQGCQSAGLTIGRVEVDREGKIVIVPGQSEAEPPTAPAENANDEWTDWTPTDDKTAA
jgi:hypothetical protein